MIAPPQPPPYVDVVEEPPPVVTPPPPPATLSAQLGSYQTRAKAEEVLLTVQIGARPDPLPVRVRPVQLAGRTWYRVIAGPLDAAGADKLCYRLRAARQPCLVRETDPDPEAGPGSYPDPMSLLLPPVPRR